MLFEQKQRSPAISVRSVLLRLRIQKSLTSFAQEFAREKKEEAKKQYEKEASRPTDSPPRLVVFVPSLF